MNTAAPLVGLDLVEVERFRRAMIRHPRLEERLFTRAEIGYCRGRGAPILHFAARFAAKEAIGKLLGTGVISWQEIELGGGASPKGSSAGCVPWVVLSGRTEAVARERGVAAVRVSLSHVDSLAGACVVVTACSLGGTMMTEDRSYAGGPGLEAAGDIPAFQTLSEKAAVFTPAQVRELDRATIEDVGVPGPVLMERAALGVSRLIRARYPDRHTLIVCGRGNNGGDGLAAARQLHLVGQPVACVVAVGSPSELTADAALNFRAAERTGVNLRVGTVPEYLWEETELIVDCLLGTGATGELRGRPAELAELINAAAARGVPVVSVDVPSGVDATTGSIAQGTVAADVTITFHSAKSGLVCPPGSEAAGEVLVWDIGIPQSLEPEPDLWVVNGDDVNVPGRRVDDHKYRAGYVAVLAGSAAYPGAAWLATQAAYRTGAGYVRLLMTTGGAQGVRNRLVEAVLQEIGSGDHLADADAVLAVLADERLGSLVAGPGLGRKPETLAAVKRVVLESEAPLVLDADGLFAFAGMAEELRSRSGVVLTPHAGELAALLGVAVSEVTIAVLAAARRAAASTGQVVLLKGSSTVIAAPSGDTRVVVQGPPQLASAGTGDVLSGVIGALLAKGLDPFEAAYAGAWVHAEAGRVRAITDPQGVLAGDLLECIPGIIAGRLYERGPSWRS
ncbi:MAG: NAD(P)H-hydrate dehydratase [Actinobacteria bacterium]|nr:NAD(P)H-hydrate dehydratase [Actinomycetota bacterium]